jgi:hypothetical protein
MTIAAHTLWRRLDAPGHEAAWLSREDDGYRLAGTAVFADDGRACALNYDLICDAAWVTQSFRLTGRRGSERIDLSVTADSKRRWFLDGREIPAVAGCVDLDLSFSAATNLFPLRRLELAVGQIAGVTSAWLTFPQLRLEPLPQTYRRTGEHTYAYDSPTLDFSTELVVDDAGFVIKYPPLWVAEPVPAVGA